MRNFQSNTYLLLVLFYFVTCKMEAQTASSFKTANDMILEGSSAASSSLQRESIEKSCNDAFSNSDFAGSLNYWKTQLAKAPDNANLNYKVGICYFFSYDQQLKALPYFKKAIKNLSKNYDFTSEKESHASPTAYYFLAQTYLSNNLPDSALKYFSRYEDCYEQHPISTEMGILMALNLKESTKNLRNVTVSNFGNVVNTPYAETNPVMRLDNKFLFFSSRRPGNKTVDTVNQKISDADIYYTSKNASGNWENPQPFKYNTSNDEAPLYLSPNGDQLYFRRISNSNTDIYRTDYIKNTWTKPVPVSAINTSFNETGISLTADGKTLYFCSDQNKAEGKYDLYRSTKQKNGRWGSVVRLSTTINTPYNQVSPHISPDGRTLFFSSNGYCKNGLGGYDIYYSELRDDNTWTEPNTMGYPINKSRDDLNYVVASEDKRYYTSLTENNSYDIFMVEGGGFDFESISASTDVVTVTNEMGVTQVMETEKNVEKEVEVAVAVDTPKPEETETLAAIEEAKEKETLAAIEEQKEKEKEIPIASDDNLKAEDPEANKELKVSDVNVENLSEAERTALVEKLKAYLAEQLKSNESVKFKVVYFDFNKSNLNLLSLNELKLLVEFLGEHPETKIEIAGHGDNKGSWETNLTLSNKRAQEVYNFLIANKVAANRMFFYGKGSAVPIAPNDTESGRSKNRRVEVFILK